LLSVSVSLYCSLFFLSNNWYLYTTNQNLLLVLGAILICSPVVVLLGYIVSLAVSPLLRRAGWYAATDRTRLQDLLALFLSFSLGMVLLRNTLAEVHLRIEYLIPVLGVIVIVAGARVSGRLLRNFGFLFLVLSMISAVSLVMAMVNAKNPLADWAAQHKSVNDTVRFNKSPNVYFIITESYSSKDALKKVYGFDNQPFYDELQKRKFAVHHNYFSNYNHTLASLPSLFAMEHHYYQISIGNFDSVGGRNMLETRSYNPVVDIFRQNNYQIQYLISTDNFMPRGAEVDYFSPPHPNFLALEIFLTHQDTTSNSFFTPKNQSFMDVIESRMQANSTVSKPTFSFIYTGVPHHSPSRWKTNDKLEINRELGKFRKKYNQNVEKANIHLLDLIDTIMSYDKDPLIIVAGDHGSWGYRLKEDENGAPVSDSLFALDRFGILMAIRFPEGYRGQFDGDFVTHVNLFRYVFAYLSDNTSILASKAAEDSYDYGPSLAIQNGHILDRYISIKLADQ
jgi:hypothetical protein